MFYDICFMFHTSQASNNTACFYDSERQFLSKKVAGHLLGLCAPFRLYYPFVVDCYHVSRIVLFRLLKQSKLGILAVPVRDVEIAKLLALFHSFYSRLTSYNLFWGLLSHVANTLW